MQRRYFIRNSALTLGALSMPHKYLVKMLAEDPWKISMLTNEIGVFTEKGGTIAFHISTDGITVIDAEFPDTAPHLVSALKEKTNLPYHRLINTHHHMDHTSGNIVFKDLTSQVLAHENSLINQRNVAIAQHKEDQQYYPNQTFTEHWSEKSGDEIFTLYYFGAGHTNGDAMIHMEKANIVHMGDLVFNRRHPYVDRSAGANMQSWIKVLDKAMNTFDDTTTFVFGHAADGYEVVGKKTDLKAFQDYLGNVLKLVADSFKAGKTKEEILNNTTIPGSPEWQGEGIQRPLEAAFEELGGS